MTYDSDRHHRRSIRWQGYDYAQVGAYFVTICVQGRLPLLREIVDGFMIPSMAGTVIEQWWHQLPKRFPRVGTDVFVVMPNHIHGIVVIEDHGGESGWSSGDSVADGQGRHGGLPLPMESRPPVGADLRVCPAPLPTPSGTDTPASLSHIVQWFKSITTHDYIRGVHDLAWPPFDGRLWQRNFWERIIRDDGELECVRHYIEQNPINGASDEENPDAAGYGG